MEAAEGAQNTVSTLDTERADASAEAAELTTKVEQLSHDIDVQLHDHQAARSKVVPDIPDTLLKLYETIRAQKGGVGAAALVGGTCEGCHTTLPQVEVEKIRKEGGLQRCDNCRRILVIHS